MLEGNTYRCKWRRSGAEYFVWVAKRPKLNATGPTLQNALDGLAGEICEATGDGEPILALHPMPPAHPKEAPWVSRDFCRLNRNGSVMIRGKGDGLFTRGWCEYCKCPRGKRTNVPLRAARAGDGDVGSPWWTHGLKGISYDPTLVSNRFLALLTRAERASCQWLEVEMPARCRTRYFECLPKQNVAPVAVRGWIVSGWKCPECATCCFSSSPTKRITWQEPQIHDWFARFRVKWPSGFVGKIGPANGLIVSISRALELLERKFSKGATLSPLGVVPRSMVNAHPKLRVREDTN